jgi:hypothetical protein
MAVASGAVAWVGGLDWIARSRGTRYAIVAAGLLAIMGVTTLSLVVRFEPPSQQPFAVRHLADIAPGLFPLVLLVVGAILLNASFRPGIPRAAYTGPLALVFGTSLLACAVGAVEWFVYEQQATTARIAEMQADQAGRHAAHLAEIEAIDPLVAMERLLVFTDSNHPPDVRARALARVRSNPEWPEALATMLEGNASLEAFTFLASNAVEDRALLAGPVNAGILRVAEWVRRSIHGGSHEAHFYEGQFSWEVERVLATADAFQGLGVDYLPAIRTLRAALDEPNEHKRVRFTCVATLDRWIAGR